MKKKPLITVLIVNYNTPFDLLVKLFTSLRNQDYPNIEIIMVDNRSTNGSLDYVKRKFPEVKVWELAKNLGFPAGINYGAKHAQGEYLFLLNPDTQVEKRAVGEMVKVIQDKPDVVGVAPKMLFAEEKNIIDSIGNCINSDASAFNLGIGQVDIGQYDNIEEVFGACFGAALIRKDAFSKDKVGLIDESFFSYYEDVDWCIRANLLGYRFLTAPKAVIYHVHAAVWRTKPYGVKYRLIERNLLRTVFKNFGKRNIAKIYYKRWRRYLFNILFKKEYRISSFQILALSLLDIPRLLFRRIKIQRKKKIPDPEIFKYSYGEQPHYNQLKYSPLYDLDTLCDMYKRLYLTRAKKKHYHIYFYLKELNSNKLCFELPQVKKRLKTVLKNEPDSVSKFINKLQVKKW